MSTRGNCKGIFPFCMDTSPEVDDSSLCICFSFVSLAKVVKLRSEYTMWIYTLARYIYQYPGIDTLCYHLFVATVELRTNG